MSSSSSLEDQKKSSSEDETYSSSESSFTQSNEGECWSAIMSSLSVFGARDEQPELVKGLK